MNICPFLLILKNNNTTGNVQNKNGEISSKPVKPLIKIKIFRYSDIQIFHLIFLTLKINNISRLWPSIGIYDSTKNQT